jgi:hypothetical protein
LFSLLPLHLRINKPKKIRPARLPMTIPAISEDPIPDDDDVDPELAPSSPDPEPEPEPEEGRSDESVLSDKTVENPFWFVEYGREGDA